MSDYILIVDDSNTIKARLDSFLKNTTVSIAAFSDVISAKRRLLQSMPAIILSVVKVGDDDRAGFKFAKDLRDHSEFAKLPVILICDVLSEELLKLAKEVGIKALFANDVEDAELIRAIGLLVPALSVNGQRALEEVPSAEREDVLVNGDNFAFAQNLLTRSLHTIKTSGLLEVIDRNGVATVVSSVTAAVCNIENSKNNIKT